MRRIAVAALAVFPLVVGVHTQAPVEFTGTLEGDLAPGRGLTPIRLTAMAAADAKATLGELADGASMIFTGALMQGTKKTAVYLLEAGDARVIVADLNGNGSFEPATERIALQPTKESGLTLTGMLQLATPGAPYPVYPIRVGLSSAQLKPPPPAPASAADGAGAAAANAAAPAAEIRGLSTSYQAFARGVVTVDGSPVKIQLMANSMDFSLNPSKGYQYIDCNGDGAFDEDFSSWEMGYGRGAPVVFHIGAGDRYVSIASVDPAAKTITLAARPSADYLRVELRVGGTLPDFAFTTIDGVARRLSDFRGKHLLIDFWGTWCGPCVGEIPYLKKAYDTYRARGLEILGMDNELPDVTADDFAKGLEKVRKFVAERGVTWTQASTESIKEQYEKRYQIVAWPTMILLDPNGVILSVDRTSKGEPGLRGDRLDQTLSKIIKH